VNLDEKRRNGEALITALNARDFDAIAASPWFDSENAEFLSAIAASEGEVYRGVDGLREWAANVEVVWEGLRIQIVEHREVDADRSLLLLDVSGRARASGVPLDLQIAQVWTWRDGALVRNQSFSDPREAFRAAGLPYKPSTRSR
jgi:ketosteroid isomerase-like protein